MSRFEELARLKEMEANATPARWELTKHSDDLMEISREDGGHGFQILFEDSDIDDPQFITDLRNAAPWLLQIAEAFQPGDAERLKWILHNYPWTMGAANCEMLRRFRNAVEEMSQ